MRVQFTLKPLTMDALTQRAEDADIAVSRLVEYVLSQWLLKNEPIVFTPKHSGVSALGVVATHSAAPVTQSAAPKPKKPCLVDTQNFRVPLGDVCGQEVKLEDIDENGYHRTCPGHWNPST